MSDLLAEVKEAGAGGSEEPLVAVAGVEVGRDGLKIKRDQSGSVGAVDDGEDAVAAGQRAEVAGRKHHAGGRQDMAGANEPVLRLTAVGSSSIWARSAGQEGGMVGST